MPEFDFDAALYVGFTDNDEIFLYPRNEATAGTYSMYITKCYSAISTVTLYWEVSASATDSTIPILQSAAPPVRGTAHRTLPHFHPKGFPST